MLVNILASFLIKGWSVVVQLLLVPLTLACLNPYEYGIWMTLSTVLIWIDSFDVGLGNGLRNKLAEFVARNEWTKARQAVSTTFFTLVLIMVPAIFILLAAEHYADLYGLLGVSPELSPHLPLIVQLSTGLVCLTFVFKFVGNVFLGLQLPAVNNALIVGGQTLSLIAIAIARLCGDEVSFLLIAVLFTAAPLVVYLLAYPVTFLKLYPRLLPSVKYYSRTMLGGIFSLGFKFFFLQTAGIVLFASSNLFISRILGPEHVSPYQIAYRYFYLSMGLFTIVIAPMWSAITDAYAKGELAWIGSCLRKGLYAWAATTLVIVVMAAVADWVYPIWTLGKVDISPSMTVLMAVYMSLIMFSLLYAHILYGIGCILLQTLVTVVEAVVFVPLAIGGLKGMGPEGIVAALIIVNLICAVTNYLQVNKLLKGRAKGIWTK